MSRPTYSIDAAARFLAHDVDPVDFVPRDGSRPPLLRRRKRPSDVLELRQASKPELDAIENAMVALHNRVAADTARRST